MQYSGGCFVVLKGKPPTKKAKVLQKQPLMTKLAAYAQHQASQQSGVKKSGEHGRKSNVTWNLLQTPDWDPKVEQTIVRQSEGVYWCLSGTDQHGFL